MSLPPGTRIGPYEVISIVGAGGMGEVYRARDPKLQRDVALKILPEVFASDSDRLGRFQREARTLAALNHPHIAGIYGFEENAGIYALALEFVDGETLADHIARGPIPVEEALPIARQIAEALEAAHEQGIVHRDLKPANIKVRRDGTVKVLDFGLAKALAAEGTGATADVLNSPTITSPAMTQMGMILGTAAYMAPEQARGKPADKRSDIWAFGCVFYEMLTGRRAFEGEEVTETIANVIRVEPAWQALPAGLSPAVAALLKRCLTKDPKQRMRDGGDVGLVLDGAFDVQQPVESSSGCALDPSVDDRTGRPPEYGRGRNFRVPLQATYRRGADSLLEHPPARPGVSKHRPACRRNLGGRSAVRLQRDGRVIRARHGSRGRTAPSGDGGGPY